MKKVFPLILLILLFELAFNYGCVTTTNISNSTTNTNKIESFFTKDNFVFSSASSAYDAAYLYHFEVYAPANFLVIKYYKSRLVPEFGVYNPKVGLLARITGEYVPQKGSFPIISFYRIKNVEFMHILNDIVQYPTNYKTGEKLTFVKGIFRGNLPYITSDGKYNKKAIWERAEGEKTFLTLQNNGISITKFQSYDDGSRIKETIYQAYLSEPIEQVIPKFGAMPNVFGFEVVKKLSVEVKPQIVDKSKFYKNQELINHEISYDKNTGKYNVNIIPSDSSFIINIEPAKYSLAYQADGYILEPKIIIFSKTFETIFPEIIYRNKDLIVNLKRITATKATKYSKISTLSFIFDVNNQGSKKIDIKEISFYVNNSIITWYDSFGLPPKAVQKDKLLITNYSDGGLESRAIITSAVRYLNKELTVDIAKEAILSLGISITYEADGQVKTLHDIQQVPFLSVLKNL